MQREGRKKVKKIQAIRYMIIAMEREGGRQFQEMLKPIGVTGTQAEAIRVLHEYGPLSLKELGALLICEGGSPSRLVDTLVKEGHAIRSTAEYDRRAVTIMLSERGIHIATEINKAETAMYRNLLSQIPDEYVNEAYHALKQIVENHPMGEKLIKRELIE